MTRAAAETKNVVGPIVSYKTPLVSVPITLARLPALLATPYTVPCSCAGPLRASIERYDGQLRPLPRPYRIAPA